LCRHIGGRDGLFGQSALRDVRFVFVEPDLSMASKAFERLHLGAYVSITELSTTRLFHSRDCNLPRRYSRLAFEAVRP